MRPCPRQLSLALGLLAAPLAAAATGEPAAPSFGWASVLPPIVAVAMALLTRQVLPSLVAAVLLGATMLAGGNPVLGFLDTTAKYAVAALADPDHASIILFSMALAGMVGVMSRSGGSQGIVDRMTPYARTPVRAQVATWLMGLVIFFDDYANSLLVGNTMRPLTDRLKISREKLAFIVDSTAAPVAGLAAVSTWVGFEVGLIQDAFKEIGRDSNAFLVFLDTIPLRFYSIFCLALVLAICLSGRDFGPMLKAEIAARRGEADRGATKGVSAQAPALTPDPDAPRRWQYAVIPIFFIFLGTASGLWISGGHGLEQKLRAQVVRERTAAAAINDVLAEASTNRVLIFVSFAGSLVALFLPIAGGVLRLEEGLEAWVEGAKTMVEAAMILVLAWSLSHVCKDLGTAPTLAAGLKGILEPRMLPALTFLASAVISFATGSSWGTMSILMPISIPLAVQLGAKVAAASGAAPGSEAFLAAEAPILLGTIGAILAGSCFGDHCSPISDTTILSSMASGCDHVEHVRTQTPYALVAGAAAVALGHIPAAYGVPVPVCLGLGLLACVAAVWLVGRRAEDFVDGGGGAST